MYSGGIIMVTTNENIKTKSEALQFLSVAIE